MSNNKQTSVEQLFHKLWDEPRDKFTWYAILKEHISIHKEEIIDAYNQGIWAEPKPFDDGEQYYNETFEQ